MFISFPYVTKVLFSLEILTTKTKNTEHIKNKNYIHKFINEKLILEFLALLESNV